MLTRVTLTKSSNSQKRKFGTDGRKKQSPFEKSLIQDENNANYTNNKNIQTNQPLSQNPFQKPLFSPSPVIEEPAAVPTVSGGPFGPISGNVGLEPTPLNKTNANGIATATYKRFTSPNTAHVASALSLLSRTTFHHR